MSVKETEDLAATCYVKRRATFYSLLWTYKRTKTKLRGLSPRANYIDLATVACQRNYFQLLRVEVCREVSMTDSYGRILGFLDRSRYFSFQVTT
jgi:hypothetical protein